MFMRQVKGLSRNSLWRRLLWFFRQFLLYGEFRWKHASDSVVRSSAKIDRPKMQVQNKELIRPRKEPLKAEVIPRFRKKRQPTPEPEPRKPEPVPEPEAKSEPVVRMVNPESLLPPPTPVRRERKHGHGSSKKISKKS